MKVSSLTSGYVNHALKSKKTLVTRLLPTMQARKVIWSVPRDLPGVLISFWSVITSISCDSESSPIGRDQHLDGPFGYTRARESRCFANQ